MAVETRVATPRSIFEAAILLPDEGARQTFVDLCCRENAALKDRVCKLLAAWKRRDASPIDAAAQMDIGVTALFESDDVDQEKLVQKQSAAPVAPPPAENLDLSTHPQIGPYKLLEQIGQGGMGAVYVAQQSTPVKRKVALKIIKPGMDTREVIARFEAERQALALMDHPNIAKVLDAGTTPRGRPYFAMELVKGETVTDYCDHNRLNLRQRLELFLQVCQAVQHAHQKGVIHRDLKPSNVLIAVHDVTPVAKVIDFGIAKAIGQSLTDKTMYTAMSQLVGTPLYMSPEQAGQSSLDVDTRTDIYALGVLLYELLTGTTPIDPETVRKAGLDEVRRIIREDEPPVPSARMSTLNAAALSTIADKRAVDPRRLARQVRGELDWVVMKCLEKDRNRRYESASALAADVQRYLSDEPVTACPPSAAYRLWKFVRRNRSRVAVAGTALVVALLVAITGGWFYLARISEQNRAESRVRESLAGAQAAIEAGNLDLAAQRVAEARGGTGPDPRRLGHLAAEVDRVGDEVEARRADEDRFQRFLKLTSEGQDKMSYSMDMSSEPLTEEALGLYAVLTADDWLSQLENSYLTAEKKNQVRDVAYTTLVSLADFNERWRKPGREYENDLKRSLEFLNRAQSLHEPTRAFYFVRAEIYLAQNEKDAANEDINRYKQMEAQTAWDYYLPAHTAGWRGDLDEAIRGYEAALRLQPNHYNSLFFLADRLGTDTISRPVEAIQVMRACIALRPDHIWAYITRAECHEKLNQMAEAEADLTTAFGLSSNGRDIDAAYRRRHDFWKRQGDVEKSRKVLEAEMAQLKAFIERNPQDAAAHHRLGNVLHDTGPPDEEFACWRKVTELDPTTDIGHNSLGTLLLDDMGLPDQAIASYRKAIEINPAYSRAYSNLGAALHKIGRTDEAIACYRKAIETNATNVQAYVNLAYHLNQQGLTDEVMTYARKAIELDPKNEQAHYSLGFALDKKGLQEQAIPVWRKAIEINPKSVLAHNELGSDLHEMARQTGEKGLLDEAIESCRKAIELNPKSAVAQNNIACALEDKGVWEEAIASYRRAIDLAPTEVVGLRNFASLLANCPDLQYRDPDQAMTLAKKCIELAPNDAHVLTLLGTAHYRLGEFKAAQTALDKAMAMDEGPYSLGFLLAMTHWQLGQKDLAVNWHQKGVEQMESKDSTRRHDALLIALRAEAAALLQLPPMMPPVTEQPQQ